jgi:hypothetical protein
MIYVNGKGIPLDTYSYIYGIETIDPFFYGLDFTEEENSMYLAIGGLGG